MKIGSLQLQNIVVSAPLAGISNLPYRLLMKKAGCALVCSEMISANGLVYQSEKTFRLLHSVPEERPISIQLFGSDPLMMAEAAGIVQAIGADVLDINFGCSVKKIVKSGSGVALMKAPQTAEAILKAVRKRISIPLTIKIRSGWDSSGNQAIQIAQIAEDAGVDAITVHPRTASQGFKGHSDWSIISKVKQKIKIPVIGNGDIIEPSDAIRMLSETGCDAVMVGRAAIGNPWIISAILATINSTPYEPVNIHQIRQTMIDYLKDSVRYLGEKHACFMMRSRLGWFVKGLPNCSRFRESIKLINSEHEAIEKIDNFFSSLPDDLIFERKRCHFSPHVLSI